MVSNLIHGREASRRVQEEKQKGKKEKNSFVLTTKVFLSFGNDQGGEREKVLQLGTCDEV